MSHERENEAGGLSAVDYTEDQINEDAYNDAEQDVVMYESDTGEYTSTDVRNPDDEDHAPHSTTHPFSSNIAKATTSSSTNAENDNVSTSSPTHQPSGSSSGQRRNTFKAQLVIKGLPRSVTEENVRKMCEVYGPISSVRILPKNDENLVFMDYPSDFCVAQAISALDGTKQFDKTIHVEFARRTSRGSNLPLDFANVLPDSDRPFADILTIYISGLPRHATQACLQRIFKPFGPIDHIRVHNQQGKNVATAFVTYTSHSAANHAVGTMNQQHVKINNESVKISVHKAKRESRPPAPSFQQNQGISQGSYQRQAGPTSSRSNPPQTTAGTAVHAHHHPVHPVHPAHPYAPQPYFAAPIHAPYVTGGPAMAPILHAPHVAAGAIVQQFDPMTGALYPAPHPYLHSMAHQGANHLQQRPGHGGAVPTTDAYGNVLAVAPLTLSQAGVSHVGTGGRSSGYSRTGSAMRNATMARARNAASGAYSDETTYGYPAQDAYGSIRQVADQSQQQSHVYYNTSASQNSHAGAAANPSKEGVELFVYGIPNGATDTDLLNEFGRVARVLSARIAQDRQKQIRDYGFVTVATREEAETAVNLLNGRPLTLSSGAASSRVMSVKINK